MAEKSKIIGLVLAGGRSQRMGGREKALLSLGGEPLALRAVARLRAQCDCVVLNANGDPARFAGLGVPVVPDSVDGYAGPLAGVLAGLDWMAAHAPDATAMLSVPVDGPFFPKDLAARLQAAAESQRAAVACATSNARWNGVYGLWSVALRDQLRHDVVTLGARKVEAWLSARRAATVDWPDIPFDPFININTPEDLAAAERLLAQRPDA